MNKTQEDNHILQYDQFKIAKRLGNIGLGLFAVVALLMPLSIFQLIDVDADNLLRLFTIMSGLLLAFLAGTIWSEALVGRIERSATNHLLISAGFAFAAFVGFSIQNRWSIMIFGLSYLILFFTEEDLRKSNQNDFNANKNNQQLVTDYLYMRRQLTYKVVIIHLFILLLYIIKG